MEEKRKRLLIELEDIVGKEFYNAKIQNWGPGGIFAGEGRSFRYPITLQDKQRGNVKTKHIDSALPPETVITGSYRMGANELGIMRALDKVLSHLESHYGLDLSRRRRES
jgi:hypothetical protein